MHLPCWSDSVMAHKVGRGKRAVAGFVVGLTVQTLSCTARAHVPEPARRAARLHVRRALRAA